ncbi:F0F1 ATP synthase subunit A [Egicoccus halophilus]|uniref:ATP synthase subunit a n=1 Tax=Egicoccus halophilus TaxID=1670830 RepID=A0A8J3ETJ3_9ACTN|nr:F0F1 ATP synthase subunit A [Egicoccus halophilus]GGI04031.1 ATP synthase subunit a [Egicoccus halophilus]
MTPFLAVEVEYGGNFDGALDDINALFDMPAIFDLGVFSINRTVLIMWLATALVFALFAAAFRDSKVVPGKLQSACELVIDFVRNIALDIIGPKGVRFVPLLTTFFIFIFAMNLMKITPGIMLPPTSRMAVTGFLALTAWAVYVGVGIKNHGFFGYLKEVSVPPGTPLAILPLLAIIEFVSNLILRPFALAIRLFANMVAGHILVVITLVTVHVFLYPRPGLPVGILALGISPLVFAFELFIIGLQAYIFTLLTAVYISSSLESH